MYVEVNDYIIPSPFFFRLFRFSMKNSIFAADFLS